MDRRLSINSDSSSVEPMDISAKTATTAPFVSSPASTSSSSSSSSLSRHTSAAVAATTALHHLHHHHHNHHHQQHIAGSAALFATTAPSHHQHRRRRRSTDEDNDDDDAENDDEDDRDDRRTVSSSPRRRYDTAGAAGVVRRENLRKKYRHLKNNNNDVGTTTTHHHHDDDDAEEDDGDDDDDGNCVDLRRVKTETRSAAEDLSAAAAAGNAAAAAAGRGGGSHHHRRSAAYTCPICEHVSDTQHEFTEHIRTHNNVSEDGQHYVCRICEKVLSSASSLDRHVLVHTGERPFNCKYCHLTFTTNGNMHRHIRTHQQRGDIPGMMGGGGANAAAAAAATNGHHHSQQQLHNPLASGGFHAMNHHHHHHHHAHANLGDTDSSDAASSDSSRSGHHISNNNNNISSHNHNGGGGNKRKSAYNDDHQLHGSDSKRAHKNAAATATSTTTTTTINNNNLIVDDATTDIPLPFSCPACGRADFASMLHLEQHMDREHPGIQAKCRCCEAVFKSHKALNAHKCSATTATEPTTPTAPQPKSGAVVTHGFKDLTFVDFSSDKFPLIARTLCEADPVRRPAAIGGGHQRFECPRCGRAFPCASAATIHADACGTSRVRLASETSEEDARRDDFFAHLDLQNKMLHQQQQSGGSSGAASSATAALFSPSQMDTSYSSLEKPSPTTTTTTVVKQEQLRTPTGPQHLSHYTHQHLPPPQPQRPFDITKDLADIQSMIQVTANGAGFMHQHLFDQQLQSHKTAGHLPLTPKEQTSAGLAQHPREEAEEAQDAEFTAEFRKMKLRGEFPCKLCTAVFPNLRALKGHNRIHVSASGPGPFRCNMCPYAIHDKQALVRHMRTHNGDRPYECAICNYAFTTKANCERHLRNRHAKTTRDEVKRAIIYHPSEDSSCDDPVKKMQIYNASYDEIDDVLASPKQQQQQLQQHQRGGGTPLSHLKEILTPPSEKSVKIQVKSMDELTRAMPTAAAIPSKQHDEKSGAAAAAATVVAPRPQVNRAMDFSMDVLDLSKKSVSAPLKPVAADDEDTADDADNDDDDDTGAHDAADDLEQKPIAYQQPPQQHEPTPAAAALLLPPPPALNALDISAMFDKTNQQMLFNVQQQQQQQQLQHQNLLGDIDPAHYLQLSQFYRNFIFPGSGFGIHPMFMPNTFPPPMPPGLGVDAQLLAKELPAHLFGMPPALAYAQPPNVAAPIAATQQQQHQQQHQQPAAPFKREAMPDVSPRSPPHHHYNEDGDSGSHRPLSMPTQQELTQRMNSLHQAAAAAAAAAAADAAAAVSASAAAAAAASSHPAADPQLSRSTHSPLSLQMPHPFSNHNGSAASAARGSPSITNTGPVKMVIKNGVLMPKQKQRRYRTERPFACEHCSARFTLRSNMERHIKQQHPQYWAQRQRGGGGGGLGPMPGNHQQQQQHHHAYQQQQQQHSPQSQHHHRHHGASAGMPLMPSQLISDQVKYAILAQQLKSRSGAAAAASANNRPNAAGDSKIPQVGDLESYFAQHHHQQQQQHQLDNNNRSSLDNANQYYAQMRERERELQLQQSKQPTEEDDDDEELRSDDDDEADGRRRASLKAERRNGDEVDEEDDDDDDDDDDDNGSELIIDEDSEPEDLSASKSPSPPIAAAAVVANSAAKKVAEDILEQAMRVRQPPTAAAIKPTEAAAPGTPDLVPVAKLIDNANIPFGGFFPSVVVADAAATAVAVAIDHSDEEGLVASGSASESNASGAEEMGNELPRNASSHRAHHSHHHHHHRRASTASSKGGGANSDGNKKKSAYSLAPNRVSCPYCQRMFPWTSSLRRHILTHTGQKPFKCSHCPLLFTTKSNCDRHLLRKHGDVESAQSLYVPLEDVKDGMLEKMMVYGDRDEEEEEDGDGDGEEDGDDDDEDEAGDDVEEVMAVKQPQPPKETTTDDAPLPAALEHLQPADAELTAARPTPDLVAGGGIGGLINAELLPFKCHLCDGSYADRHSCLDHIKLTHSADFELLAAKGAIETDVSSDPQPVSAEDEDVPPPAIVAAAQMAGKSGGKYPDYANRKVMCAFCMRRFWSTEDLRRHMRTHSGERPFQCQICQRKFTLKHSMLRHQKKHAHHHYHQAQAQQSQQQSQQQQSQQPQQPNSASDMSDDEAAMMRLPGTPPSSLLRSSIGGGSATKQLPELLPKEMSWQLQLEHGESLVAALRKAHFFRAAAAAAAAAASGAAASPPPPVASMEATLAAAAAAAGSGTSDLIGNLLGISDQGMLSQVLRSSADEAAKLLGVEK